MKRLLFSLLLLAGQQLVLAQIAPPVAAATGHGQLTGTVVDATTKQPIPFATVALLDAATDKPVDGVSGDDQGRFTLRRIAAGSYTLQISFVGYKPLEKPGLVFTSQGETLDLGPLALATSATQLGEVVVQGQKALIEEKVDRTVYNAEQDHTTQGGDATDVLRRVPLLSVDQGGNVLLRGSSSIKVLINNKPSTLAAGSIADALKQIPADQIKSVEVITSPSAKYDAEGAGGVINIITKKDDLLGKTLSVTTSTGNQNSSLGLNGSYRVGRMAFSLGGSGRTNYNIPSPFLNSQQIYSAPGVLASSTRQQANTHYRDLAGQYTLGWEFTVDKNSLLWASLRYGVRNVGRDEDNLATVSDFYSPGAAPTQSSDTRTVRSTTNSATVDVSLGYTHTTAKPQQELSLLAAYSRNNGHNDFTNGVFDRLENGTRLADYRLQNLNASHTQEATLQLDYQTPLGPKQLLEVGAKDITRQVTSAYTYQQADGLSDAPYVPLPGAGLDNTLNYRQNVAAGYATYTLGLPHDYTLKAGARYEYTTINAQFGSGGSEAAVPSYGLLVPSLNVSRKLANGNLLKAGYNRRIQRPSLQFLNPNFLASNPRTPSQGNPLLRPEYSNNFEVGYSTAVKRVSLSMSAYTRTTTGAIRQELRPVTAQEVATYGVAKDAILSTYGNIGQERDYGGSLSVNAKIGSKFTFTAGPDLYYAVLRNNGPDAAYNATNKGFVISGRASATYALTDKWSLQAFGFTSGRELQLQGYSTGFSLHSLSLRREFAEKRGSFGVGAENFFAPKIPFRNFSTSPLLTQTGSDTPNRFAVKAYFSFRVGKLKLDDRKKEVNNNDLKGGN